MPSTRAAPPQSSRQSATASSCVPVVQTSSTSRRASTCSMRWLISRPACSLEDLALIVVGIALAYENLGVGHPVRTRLLAPLLTAKNELAITARERYHDPR